MEGEGRHRERALHAHEASESAVTVLELFEHEAVGDWIHPGAAVTVEARAEHAELRELGYEITWKLLAFVKLPRPREVPLAHEAPDRRLDELFVFTELAVTRAERGKRHGVHLRSSTRARGPSGLEGATPAPQIEKVQDLRISRTAVPQMKQ